MASWESRPITADDLDECARELMREEKPVVATIVHHEAVAKRMYPYWRLMASRSTRWMVGWNSAYDERKWPGTIDPTYGLWAVVQD